MMKRTILIATLFFAQSLFSFDEEKINLLLSEYATSMIAYSKNKDVEEAYRKLNAIFDNLSANHDNDLFGNEVKCQLLTYLRYIEDDFDYNLEVEINNHKIYPCERFIEGKKYRFASFSKMTNYKGATTTVDYLMVIDISESEYMIAGLYLKLANVEKKYLGNCQINETSDEVKRQREDKQRFIRSHLKKAQELFRQRKYPKALNHFKEVVENDPNNQTAVDAIRQCEQLIAIKDYKIHIEDLIKGKKYNVALKEIKNANASGVRFDGAWENNIKATCKKGNHKLKLERLLAEADYLLRIHRYKAARNAYEKVLRLEPNNTSILNKIETCKNGDPDYVRKQIQIAYNTALKSSKYYISTFKTYKKYEDTNLLRGEHYDFMTRLLLRKRKKAAKSIGYSRNYAKHLIGKYFLLAKKKGYDNSELRYIIPEEYQYGSR